MSSNALPINYLSNVRLSSSFPMRWEIVRNPDPIAPHCHEFCEIGMVTSGTAWHHTESHSHQIERGDVLVSFPNSIHSFSDIKGLSKINIYYIAEWFLPDLISSDGTFIGPLFFSDTSRSGKHRHTMTFHINEESINKIESELIDSKSPPAPSLSVKWTTSCFSKIILILANEYISHHEITNHQLPENIFRLIEDIEKSAFIGVIPDFTQTAHKLGVDRDYLSRAFREAMGLSPMQYFQKRRVQIACRKILETKLRLCEIAQELGYSDEAHFSRHFKKEIGTSPARYRKKFCASGQEQIGIYRTLTDTSVQYSTNQG